MSVKVAKTIRVVLLVLACIVCIVGLSLTKKAEKKAATDMSKINIQVVARDCSYQADNSYYGGCYYIDFTYEIINNTKVTWDYLKIITSVYDKNGTSLGTITSQFDDMKLKAGGSVKKITELEDRQPDDFFTALYESDFSDLIFESEVSYGTYYKK